MLLGVPDDFNQPIWEGELEPESEPTSEEIKFAHPPQRLEYLPIVSIGQPETWKLSELYSNSIPTWLQTKLSESQLYLVRFACSFRPRRAEFQISQANFLVELLPDNQQNRAIAFDLHPLEINQEVQRNLKVTLSPSLKFMNVQGSLGGTEFALEYPELQPTILGTGVGENRPNWEYNKAQGMGIQGSKFMHLILKVPNNMQRVRAKLKLTAMLEANRNPITRLFLRNDNKNEQDSDCLLINLIG